ncbi:MAG: T9SS type A sorting domain-containing protein [Bacteroidota bacterium]
MKNFFTFLSVIVLSFGLQAQYTYTDFEENQNVSFTGWPNAPVTIENPDASGINTSDSVAEFVRSGEAWAHALTELDGTINFDEGTTFTIKVWAPIVNEMLFKLESSDGSSVIENFKDIETTEEWVEMSFDFPDAENGVYSKIVLFFDVGNSTDNTYYFDDLAGPGYEGGGSGGTPVDLPVTFEDEDVTYALTDFGGNASEIVVDPTDENNMVAKTIKTESAETWAGTTVGGTEGFETPIPFEEGATVMKVAVWSPEEGTPIRLKVEDASDGEISVETEANTTVAEAWEVLEFDFSEEAEGTAEINYDNTYNKASIFFNFGTDGGTAGEQTYYWDDMVFALEGEQYIYTDFDENHNEEFTGWPNAPELVANPDPSGINTSENVGEWVRTEEQWAHIYSELDGTINFDETTTFNMKVWAPIANEVLLKLENADGSVFLESFQDVESTEEWVELSFDFPGAENDTYSKIVIFFDFSNTTDNTYYFDDLVGPAYTGGGSGGTPVDLPVTFEDEEVNYALTDFGGNESEIVVDPTDEDNMVAKTVKTESAETWAGTTVGGTVGFETPIPFAEDETVMSVAVWSPAADTPIRLKVEDASNAEISVETEATTTVAEEWEVLQFDFSEEAEGTAEINYDNTYNKASIFFNFDTDGATAGEQTYYWDDMTFVGSTTSYSELELSEVNIFPNPAEEYVKIASKISFDKVIMQDIQGRNVKQKIVQGKQTKLNVSDLQEGVYIINLYSNNQSVGYKKVIVR